MTHVPPPPAYGYVAPPPSRNRTNPLPWVLVAVLAVVAVTLGVLLALGSGDSSDSERGFATPEEAIEFSTEQLADGDAPAALSAWAVDAQAENLDLEASLDHVGAYSPHDTAALPSDDELFVELARTSRAALAAQQYRRLAFSLLLPDIDVDTVVLLDDEISADDIADPLDSARLAGLRPERIDRVEGPERFDEVLADQADIVGADERREYVVLYEWEGDTYLGGVGVLRYDDEWFVESLTSTFAGTSFGALEPTSSADYEDLLADLADD